MVTELGYDANLVLRPNAWLHFHFYAMEELRMDMDILNHARPSGAARMGIHGCD